MAKIKFKTDAKGDFAERSSFKIAKTDYFDPTGNNEAFVKLLSPKGASLKVLTLTINKKTHNVALPAGKVITIGPFPMQAGDNKISFDGSSDTPDTAHELEITPKLLK